MPLGANSWGKSRVRVSKVLRGDPTDDILDLNVDIQLTASDVDVAHTEGDNRGVLPTPSVFGRALHQPLRGFADLAGSDVEIFQGERASWPPAKQDWVQAISLAMRRRAVRGTRCFDVT